MVGGALVSRLDCVGGGGVVMPLCVCPKVKETGSFSASS